MFENLSNYVRIAFSDFAEALEKHQLWRHMAIIEVKARYRRTILGPFWATMSLAIFVGALGMLYAQLWNADVNKYLPYLAAGFTMWLLVSSLMMEGCNVFASAEGIVKQIRLPFSLFILAMLVRNVLISAHHLIVFIIVMVIFSIQINFATLLFIPGLILVLLNMTWFALVFGPLCTRFRDVPQLVASILQITMFVTPIMWPVEYGRGLAQSIFVDANPFYHLIEVVRAPLLGQVPSMYVYIYLIVLSAIGLCIGTVFFGRSRGRLVFWM